MAGEVRDYEGGEPIVKLAFAFGGVQVQVECLCSNTSWLLVARRVIFVDKVGFDIGPRQFSTVLNLGRNMGQTLRFRTGVAIVISVFWILIEAFA